MSLTVGSLFSGIGGLELGLERAGMETKWQVEIDDYCRRVLTKHWPDVPKFGDIRELTGHELAPVDLLCGGFPCQDISNAGKRAGIEGERSGLWRDMLRLIRVVRPRYVLLENVSALLVRGIDVVLRDLSESGFDAEWDCIPAAFVGAPHIRYRVYVLAYSRSKRHRTQNETIFAGRASSQLRDRWSSEPGMGRVAHGVSRRVDRLRRLGNAVVPAVAQWIGQRIVDYDEEVA